MISVDSEIVLASSCQASKIAYSEQIVHFRGSDYETIRTQVAMVCGRSIIRSYADGPYTANDDLLVSKIELLESVRLL